MDISCLALPQFVPRPCQYRPKKRLAPHSHPLVTAHSSRKALANILQSSNFPIPFKLIPCYAFYVLLHLTPKGAWTMEWITPQHEEIDLHCEVSSYANAEL